MRHTNLWRTATMLCFIALAVIISTSACSPKQHTSTKWHQWSVIDSLQQQERDALLFHTTTLLVSAESNSNRIKSLSEMVDEEETKKSNEKRYAGLIVIGLFLTIVLVIGGGLYLQKKFIK